MIKRTAPPAVVALAAPSAAPLLVVKIVPPPQPQPVLPMTGAVWTELANTKFARPIITRE